MKAKVTFYARINDSEIFNELDSVEVELTQEPEVITDANRQAGEHIKATSRVNLNMVDAMKAMIQKMEN